MSAGAIDWYDESLADHRRRLRNGILFSLAVHAALVAAFVIAPPRPLAPRPEVLQVELIAATPGAPTGQRPSPPPPPPESKAPPPPPEAPPPAPPAPPVAKAPVQVLPEETPGRIRKAPPEKRKAKVVAKAEPRPRRPKKEEALSYEDAMAALDQELGVDETADLLQPVPKTSESDVSSGLSEPVSKSRPGVSISPELAEWNRKVQRLIRSRWVIPAAFRNRGLETGLELRLAASGDLIGEPRVVRSSGDPYFDDNAVRAVMKVAPLPSPPEPGLQIFIFRSEAE